MKIYALSKNAFNALMISNEIDCDNLGNHKNLYIISINDTHGEMSKSFFEECEADNVLRLYFDDTNGGEPGYIPFSETDGRKVLEFIEKIEEKDNTQIVVHCTAGQNRSGSVAKFAADYFNYDRNTLLRDNPIIKGNAEVSRILNNLYFH